MAEKTLLEKIGDGAKNFFKRTPATTKAAEEIGSLLGPVFREIPPEGNTQKLIDEGISGWAYVAVSAIADEVSATDLLLYQRRGKDWKVKDQHSILDLINRPNPLQTKEEFFWLTTGYLLAVGEAVWILNNDRNPTDMIIFNPSRVTPIFGEDHTIARYKLLLANGTTEEIPSERVIFLKLPSFSNPFRGTGVMEYITKSIDTDNFVQDYIRTFFYNSAMPHGVLQSDQEITIEHGKALLRNFEAKHRGVKNAHRTALLDKGLKFSNIEHNFQQMEMGALDLRTMNRVLAAFKVPKSVLGISEDVNRANAEAASYTFARRAVMPKLKMLEAQLNQYLIPKFSDGVNLWFEFAPIIASDQLIQAQTEEIRIRSGVRTANEYRAEDGLQPLPEKADEPLQLTAKTNAEEEKQKILNDRINTRKHLSARDRKILEIDAAIMDEAKKIVEKKYAEKINKGPYSESDIIAFHSKKIDKTDAIEKDFKDRLMQNQARIRTEILAQLTGKSRRKATELKIAFDEEEEASILASLTQPYLERSILAQAALTAALLDIDNTLDNQDTRARAFMRKWSEKLGKSTSKTQNETIQRILQDWGATEGASIADLKKTLTEHLADSAKAETIARTEVSRAAGFAQETVYKDAGAIGKKWATAIDERVCEFCSELDGEVVEISDAFLDSGDSLTGRDDGTLDASYGAVVSAPLHPNCRCDLLPIFENSKEAKTLEESFNRIQKSFLEPKKETEEEEK